MGHQRIGLNNNNEASLIQGIYEYYDKSKKVLESFGGPSVYFHQEAIKAQKSNFLGHRHIEMIYATLASWGMHRMGDEEDTKAKLVEYAIFEESILKNQAKFIELRESALNKITFSEYSKILETIKQTYFNMNISISNTSLIANSKTFAHILPDLFPPIDRQYTLRFFNQDATEFFDKKGKYRQVNVPSDENMQYEKFLSVCQKIKILFDNIDSSKFIVDGHGFNTSYPKIMDNIIVAFVKSIPKPILNKEV